MINPSLRLTSYKSGKGDRLVFRSRESSRCSVQAVTTLQCSSSRSNRSIALLRPKRSNPHNQNFGDVSTFRQFPKRRNDDRRLES